MTHIYIEHLILDHDTAMQIAKYLRKHLPDIWHELAEALRQAEKLDEIDVNLN